MHTDNLAQKPYADSTWHSTLAKAIFILRKNGFAVEAFSADRFGYYVTNSAGAQRSFVSIIELIIFAKEEIPESRWIEDDGAKELERYLLAELSITFNGQQYQYSEYLYDHALDAINYAKLMRASKHQTTITTSQPQYLEQEGPNEEEKQRMATYGITYDGKHYQYAGYRYGRLDDAVNYAKIIACNENRTALRTASGT